MPTDLIRYDLLVQDALRTVVRRVLSDAARNGLPGEHHFNISFKTHAPGVGLPAAMKQKYPDEMTIILQHEFWDLTVNADHFEVGLSFSRRPERLTIPFDAIVAFSDPSVPFGFKLEPRESAPADAAPAALSTDIPKKERTEPASAPKLSPSPAPAPLPAPAAAKPAAAPASARATKNADAPAKSPDAPKAREPGEAAKVVSIDAFRKK